MFPAGRGKPISIAGNFNPDHHRTARAAMVAPSGADIRGRQIRKVDGYNTG
jgi:hypothetical protein